MVKRYCLLIIFLSSSLAYAGDKIVLDDSFSVSLIAPKMYSLKDKSGKLRLEDVLHPNNLGLWKSGNLQVSSSYYWIKFTVANINNHGRNFIEILQPLLDDVELYTPDSSGKYHVQRAGLKYPFYSRKYPQSTNYLFDLNLAPGQEKTYFVRLKSDEQVLVPIQLINRSRLEKVSAGRTLWLGIYCGIIVVMVLYNLFIYMSIRDRSYLYYVLHTLFVGLTQASLVGFTYKYLWPDSPWFGNYSNFLFTCLVSIVGVQFLIEFMRVKSQSQTAFVILKVFQAIYLVYLLTSLAGYYSVTYTAILVTQSVIALFILGLAGYYYRKGFAEAKYYLIGWSSLMLGIIVFVCRDYGLLPYNNITSYSLMFGSAAEITLLSFALADKINIYKSDKEKSQEEALQALRENERIVREQNVILEQKVSERTRELNEVNQDLNKVLKELKDAEGQLVESEKMAALGQLTAGIAHEINNPINFVTSNVAPLKRDVDTLLDMIDTIEQVGLSDDALEEKQQQIEDIKEEMDFDYLKMEINHLIKGINEGAVRTAEIVKGLRIFSRVDESDLKTADINEGLDSTMILLNNQLNNKIRLVKEYGDIPPIECYPGKLNQVFLNIISNAIQAINKRHGDKSDGVLKINTTCGDNSILVKVEDNGTGMDETTKKKIFEPFFTTKDVGEGTGLGMSIAYNIIKKHNGQIHINSTPGVGTEFILDLPITHNPAAN